MKNKGRFLVIIGLTILIILTIFLKRKTETSPIKKVEEKTTQITEKPLSETLSVTTEKETLFKSPQEKPEKDYLAIVNNFKITKEYLDKILQLLPEQYKEIYKNDKLSFLEELIVRELLYQEAEKMGIASQIIEKDIEKKKDLAIQGLLNELSKDLEVSDKEAEEFYQSHKDEISGNFSEIKEKIKEYLKEEKRKEKIDRFIEELKNKGKIIKNEEWIKQQERLKPQNPLEKALKSKKPTVVDFGAGYCMPCKMMLPILEELKKEYKDKANIIVLEISEYRDLAYKYKIKVIPTQIFFDKNGNEYWRHEGFLPKEEIIKKLKELGCE